MPPITTGSSPRGQLYRGPTKPGIHSYNLRRRTVSARPQRRFLNALRVLLLLAGLGGLGYYGYSLADQYVYQAYANWAFDQGIAGHHVTFTDYLRAETPLRYFVPPAPAPPTIAKSPATPSEPGVVAPPRPTTGDLLGRLEIPRLNLSAVVREGVDDDTLRRAVGHIPSTALPGEAGNFSIAAHRDTLFRALKDIKKDDRVTFQSENHTFTYQVVSTRIVKPTDISVLNPERDQEPAADHAGEPVVSGLQKTLTMITCYPFYFVGSAPERFIVKARLVEDQPVDKGAEAGAAPLPPASEPDVAPSTKPAAPKPTARNGPPHKSLASAPHRPRQTRGFSHPASDSQFAAVSNPQDYDSPRPHPGFWRKLSKFLARHSN